ncbi:MAG: N-acetylmuramoyl-L-alanine amidase [Alphaproteobacteria bacterium]|nr:N-acetylmuramoyl-L-alanine amidase [Alphaproteobacteria bacterium]
MHGLLPLLRPDCSLPAHISPSPNHGDRKGQLPDAIILHYTGIATGAGALTHLCAERSQVSAHYLVLEDGELFQLVAEERRAWHAGIGVWAGNRDMNSVSIGIEIANPGHSGGLPPYPSAQIETVIALCRDITLRWKIKPSRILAHSDLAPDRKIDPGEHFPWSRLAKAGIGHFVSPLVIEGGPRLELGATGPDVEALQTMLFGYGYGIDVTGVYDTKTKSAITSFQRHFRSTLVDGIADASTIATLKKLIAALPAN